jgi:mono-ADP-ribosyltransferase sirtuin 6
LEEKVEDEEVTKMAAIACARKLRESTNAVVYTDAGVSTSTGIPDYRGPNGIWTVMATGRIPDSMVDISDVSPSYTHMCIAKLVHVGFLKGCVSTNVDGLHYKSGLEPLKDLAELHGNLFCERCKNCEAEVMQPFPIRGTVSRETGRVCKQCGGPYADSIIHFGEELPRKHLGLALNMATRSDFSLVIGSSMRVAPSNTLPMDKKMPRQVCVVNAMDVPFDVTESIGVRSYGKAESFLFRLMKELDLEPDSLANNYHSTVGAQM